MMPPLDRGILYGVYVKRYAGWHVEDQLAPSIGRMLNLKSHLFFAADGNSCIPETLEADHAARVCDAACHLGDFEAGLLYGLTGVCPEALDRLRDEAAEATADAYRELYGEIGDHI